MDSCLVSSYCFVVVVVVLSFQCMLKLCTYIHSLTGVTRRLEKRQLMSYVQYLCFIVVESLIICGSPRAMKNID